MAVRRPLNLGQRGMTIGAFTPPYMPPTQSGEAQKPLGAERPQGNSRAEALAAALADGDLMRPTGSGTIAEALARGGEAFIASRGATAAAEREENRYADALGFQNSEEKRQQRNDDADADYRARALAQDQSQFEASSAQDQGQFDQQLALTRRAQDLQRGGGGGGQAPSGYRYTQGGDLEAIPGGPADLRANAEGRARADQLDASSRSLTQAIGALNTAIPLVSWDSTGTVGQAMRGVGGTRAFNLNEALEPVRAILSFETLAEMRRNSTTGGALGSIAVRELELLGNIYTSLNTARSTEEFESALTDLRAQLTVARDAVMAARGEVATDQPTPSGANNRVRGAVTRWGRDAQGRPVPQ